MSARRRRKKEFFKSERDGKARYAEDTSKVGEVREIEAELRRRARRKKVMYEKLDVVNSR